MNAAPPPSPLPPPAGPSALRALVVEDNEINLRVVSALLKRMGYQVTAAENGQIGVDRFKSEGQPDVVLMDLQMPVMDGYEATRLIRAWEASEGLTRTPIIAVTANAFQEFRDRCFQVGMDDFLTKPLLPQVLSDALQRYVHPRNQA